MKKRFALVFAIIFALSMLIIFSGCRGDDWYYDSETAQWTKIYPGSSGNYSGSTGSAFGSSSSSDSGGSTYVDPFSPAVTGLTTTQSQAVEEAYSYLNAMSFSREGLIDQLEYEGFSRSDAEAAVDYINPDWYRQAELEAKSYLRSSAFSYEGLVDQLEYEGFTHDEAVYGVDNCGADWYEQAVESAESYLRIFDFSRSELIDQLEYEGFTYDQASYAADRVF